MKKVLVVIAMVLFSSPTFAFTKCGYGLIDRLEHVHGDDHWIRFHTTSIRADNWDSEKKVEKKNNIYAQKTGMMNMISMWNDEVTIWTEKAALIASAFISQIPVQVLSSDENCQGPQDEFNIMLCIQESDCKASRFN